MGPQLPECQTSVDHDHDPHAPDAESQRSSARPLTIPEVASARMSCEEARQLLSEYTIYRCKITECSDIYEARSGEGGMTDSDISALKVFARKQDSPSPNGYSAELKMLESPQTSRSLRLFSLLLSLDHRWPESLSFPPFMGPEDEPDIQRQHPLQGPKARRRWLFHSRRRRHLTRSLGDKMAVLDWGSFCAGGAATLVIIYYGRAVAAGEQACSGPEASHSWPIPLSLVGHLAKSLSCPSLLLYMAASCIYMAVGLLHMCRPPRYWADCGIVALITSLLIGALFGSRAMLEALIAGGFLSLLCCKVLIPRILRHPKGNHSGRTENSELALTNMHTQQCLSKQGHSGSHCEASFRCDVGCKVSTPRTRR
ncbi:hypothetical protein B0H67DRAFT_302033 [Lasiosphaeris hirsuta]|uniref:Transmembrane protein n=1 Tax=Lasiosphaeris hirsuta TaxID=260670 RepID=A0AA40A9R3_9PEZI|nr:hypothetical protein B0H67DRAFT_302033 [Lasiosphaeris hirsuta]